MTIYEALGRAFPGLREAGGDSAIAILVEGDLAEALPNWGVIFARMLPVFMDSETTQPAALKAVWECILANYDLACAHRDRQRAAEEAEAKRIDDIVRAAVLKKQIAAESAAQPELL